MFAEEMVKVKQDLLVAQEYALTLERDKDRLASELRLAKDRAGKAEERAEQAETSAASERRRASELQDRVSLYDITANEKNQAVTDLANTNKKLEDTTAKLKATRVELKSVSDELDGLRQTYAEREKEFERANEVLDAFRKRLELDAVISGE